MNNDISDIASPAVRRAYLRGALKNGYDHGKLDQHLPLHSLPFTRHREPAYRKANALAIAWTRGWFRGQRAAERRDKPNQ